MLRLFRLSTLLFLVVLLTTSVSSVLGASSCADVVDEDMSFSSLEDSEDTTDKSHVPHDSVAFFWLFHPSVLSFGATFLVFLYREFCRWFILSSVAWYPVP